MEIASPPPSPPLIDVPTLLGSHLRDGVTICVIALAILAGTCLRALVYFQHTVIFMRYEGIDAAGAVVELHPTGEHADFLAGRDARKKMQRRAVVLAKGFAKQLARDPAVRARNIVEIRWSLRTGAQRHKLKDSAHGQVAVKANVLSSPEAPKP